MKSSPNPHNFLHTATIAALAAACIFWSLAVAFSCSITSQTVSPEWYDPPEKCPSFTKNETWTLTFSDGQSESKTVTGNGTCTSSQFLTCYPYFYDATVTTGTNALGQRWVKWKKETENNYADVNNSAACITSGVRTQFVVVHYCDGETGGDDQCNFTEGYEQLQDGGGDRRCYSPIVIDTAGDGVSLTGASAGVPFDLDGDGAAERLAWTRPGSDDAWLALDRDGNGVVDGGRELFGNFTPQSPPPPGESRNGFRALAEYDEPSKGGNGDGRIDAADAVFGRLLLWRDSNHDGASAASELHTLPQLGVARIDLDYREASRRDGHGNLFRYRAKVYGAGGAHLGRWAYDVFLLRER